MTITLTSAAVPKRGEDLFAKEALSSSAGNQDLALLADLHTVEGGGSTGFGVNTFSLTTASAVEGQQKTILLSGTGEIKLLFAGTSSGALVMTADQDCTHLKFLDGLWRVVSTSATFASST